MKLPEQNLFLETKAISDIFANRIYTVAIAQLVRASDCGSEGRGFEPHWSPHIKNFSCWRSFFILSIHQKAVLKGFKYYKTREFALLLQQCLK